MSLHTEKEFETAKVKKKNATSQEKK